MIENLEPEIRFSTKKYKKHKRHLTKHLKHEYRHNLNSGHSVADAKWNCA